MAIFHADLKAFSRAKGQSAVAAAAYRIGSALRDDRTGEWHNFSRKSGVLGVHLHAARDAPAWASSAAELWARAESHETRRNACVARELVVALPSELPPLERAVLACAMAEWLVQRYGVAVMTALHAPDRKGDARNFHAHLLMTTRRVTASGFAAKVRVLDDRVTGKLEVRAIRAMVAARTNEALARFGLATRIDHRSFKEQAHSAAASGDYVAATTLLREPTRKEGRAVTAEKRRGRMMAPARRNTARVQRNAQRQAKMAARLASPIPRPHSVRRGRLRIAQPMGRDSMRAVRAEGRGARVLNEQAEGLRQTLRLEAELAEAYRQQLAQTITDQIPKSAQSYTPAEAIIGTPEATLTQRSTLKKTVADRSANKRPRSRREWAQHRQRQRGDPQQTSEPVRPGRAETPRSRRPSR